MRREIRAQQPLFTAKYSVISALCALSICFFSALPKYAHCEVLGNDDSLSESSEVQIKIRRLEHGIDAQKHEIIISAEQERNILAELEVLDKRIEKQQLSLERLEIKMLRQEGLIEREESDLQAMRARKDTAESHLQKRISAFYTMGKVGFLNVAFSTKSLPELLSFRDSFESMIEYDKTLIADFRKSIAGLERAKAALGLEQSILIDFVDEAAQKSKDLLSTKNKKSTLLNQVHTKNQLHRQAVREMLQASEELSLSLTEIDNKNKLKAQVFRRHKGEIIPPVDGTVITRFHEEKVNKLGISQKCLGIEFAADDGTNIIAVEKGEVVFSGYLRGYGNTVILNHGFKYFTVTSRIEKILVREGDNVNSGDIIGIMGDTATLFDEGLYFEIRHKKKAVDPLLWLDETKLSDSEKPLAEQ